MTCLSTFTWTVLVTRSKKWGILFVLSMLGSEIAIGQDKPDSTSGLGVFGNTLGIHEHDTLTIAGNVVVLDCTTIKGTGTLSLRSEKPQRVLARHSQVRNLHINNPTTVRLEGELLVAEELTIERAVFDTRTGHLSLSDSSQLRLRAAGRLVLADNELSGHIPTKPWPDGRTLWALLSSEMYGPLALVTQRQYVAPGAVAQLVSQPQTTVSPPPESE
ncbi:hypothetical protein [Spirosoma validum]|uniref:Uncharacterized protein n=1 Tax=Spirosoma validum TaxID=2771355 RepID=A0A927B9A3_9BACT|nr:hypothetical protein [Spirosoma validum]MBD2757497.1 hypothetical protein [Spirosoma validum]